MKAKVECVLRSIYLQLLTEEINLVVVSQVTKTLLSDLVFYVFNLPLNLDSVQSSITALKYGLY